MEQYLKQFLIACALASGCAAQAEPVICQLSKETRLPRGFEHKIIATKALDTDTRLHNFTINYSESDSSGRVVLVGVQIANGDFSGAWSSKYFLQAQISETSSSGAETNALGRAKSDSLPVETSVELTRPNLNFDVYHVNCVGGSKSSR